MHLIFDEVARTYHRGKSLGAIMISAVGILSHFPAPALADEVNCGDPRGQAQQVICASAELREIDAELWKTYASAIRTPGDHWNTRLAQGDWIFRRDKCGRFLRCIKRAYAERLGELLPILTGTPVSRVAKNMVPKWCGKAAEPSEVTICSDPYLAAYERRMEDAYRKALPREGSTSLIEEQKDWLNERNSCGDDTGCLMSAYQERIRVISGNPSKPKSYYGSRAGMYVSVVSKSGTGTENATMLFKLTKQDAKDYCVEYEGNYSAACVKSTMDGWSMSSIVTANCALGTWTDLLGERYQYAEVQKWEASGPEASAKSNVLSVLYELCPKYLEQ